MTGTCDHCNASTPLQMLTAFRKAGREEHRAKHLLMCPPCYALWWHAEEVAARSLETHAGGPGRPRKDVSVGLEEVG